MKKLFKHINKRSLRLAILLDRMMRRLPIWVWISLATVTAFSAFLIIYIGTAHADSQGPLSASSTSDCVDDNTGSIGTVTWTNPGNAFSSNNTYATASLGNTATSHYIKCTNYGFSIPTGSTINGIVVGVERNTSRTTNGGAQDAAVRAVKGGTVGTTDKSTSTAYTTSDVYEDHGTSSDLWGTTWTVSDINASNFGAAFAAKRPGTGGSNMTISVDHIRITVYYTPPVTAYNQASYRVFNNQDVSGGTTYVNAYGISTADDAVGIIKTSDGGYVTVGNTTVSGNVVMYTQKYDPAGNLLWSQGYGCSGGTWGNGIAQLTNGDIVVVGYSNCMGTGGGTDMVFAIYKSYGSLYEARSWGGTLTDQANAVSATTDGGFAVVGLTASFGAGSNDSFIIKYDSSYTLSWNKVWGGTGSEGANAVTATADGGYVVTGQTASFGAGGNDSFILKYDSSGTLSWNKVWGGTGSDNGRGIVQTTDGGYAEIGFTASFGAGSDDFFLLKYDSSGTLSWNKVWGGTGRDDGLAMIATSDGGVAVTGYTASFSLATEAIATIKYDSSGNVTWNKTWDSTSNNEEAYGIAVAGDGGYVVAGFTDSYGSGSDDVVLLKYDSSGGIANCSTHCSSPSATTSSPSATTSSPSATTSSPSATISSLSGTSSAPAMTTTNVVAIDPTSIDVGSTLAALNTAATVPGDGQPFRLRIDVGISSLNLAANASSLKLQYAPRSGTCDTSFSGETYSDVTDTTTIRYYDNTNAVNGLPLATNANDPTDGGNTLVRQSYQEKQTTIFSNPTAVNTSQDGVWDFALTTYDTLTGTHYCFRLVKQLGLSTINLDTYTNIPEIITAASTYGQDSYRVFGAGSAISTFAKGLTYDLGAVSFDTTGVTKTSDGGFAVTGFRDLSTISCMPSCIDIESISAVIAKYTSTGTLSWEHEWGGAGGFSQGASIVQTSDSGYAITGVTSDFGAGSTDAFLAKFDSSGSLSWSKTWGGTNQDSGYSLVQTSDSGYAVTGYTYSFGAGSSDVFLAKFDSSGSLSWSKTWGGTNAENGESVVQTSDGGYAITGYTASFGLSGNHIILLKYDSSGSLSWNKEWEGLANVDDIGFSLVQASDSGYAIAGRTSAFGAGDADLLLTKFDSSGNLSWSTTWGGSAFDVGLGLFKTSDNGYAVAGSAASFSGTSGDLVVLKFDSSGAQNWARAYTTASLGAASGNSIVQASDGGYAVGGELNGEALLIKYDTEGGLNNCGGACYIPRHATMTSPTATIATPSATTNSPTATINSPSVTLASNYVEDTFASAGSSASVGAPLSTQNKPYDALKLGSQFRLRVDIGVGASGTDVSGQAFKLQYSVRGSDLACDASFTGESYADVTTTTPIYYYDGSGNATGDGASGDYANDPTDGSSLIAPQTYVEANNFNNDLLAIYAGQSGEWDFSLAVKSGTMIGSDYCLRIVKSDGTTLDSYNQIADIAYGPSMMSLMRQEAWFNRSGVRQNFFIKGQ